MAQRKVLKMSTIPILFILTLLTGCSDISDIDLIPERQVSISGKVVDAVTGDPIADAFVAVGARECSLLGDGPFDNPGGRRVAPDGSFSLARSGEFCGFNLQVWGDPDVPTVDRAFHRETTSLGYGDNGPLTVELARLSWVRVTLSAELQMTPNDSLIVLVRSQVESSRVMSFVGDDAVPSEIRISSLGDDEAEITWTITRAGVTQRYSETVDTPGHQTVRYTIRY